MQEIKKSGMDKTISESPDISGRLAKKGKQSPSSIPVEKRAEGILELALTVSGFSLALFMVAHLALHLTVLVGAGVYDAIADFLERYFLLQAIVPPLAILFFLHVYFAARKVPTRVNQQLTLFRHARKLRHFDTWAWILQIVTGIAVLVLGFTHVWVIVTDLPIEAARSGARVADIYAWYYVPFQIVLYPHIAIGLYRISVKWWAVSRPWAHRIMTIGLAVIMALAIAVLVALFRLGGSA